MIQMFLDESGDLGIKGSKYFVLTIIKFESDKEYKKLVNVANRMKKGKFKKEMKNKKEIKAYTSTTDMKNHMIDKLNNSNINSYSIILNKQKLEIKKVLMEKNANEVYMELVYNLLFKMDINKNIVLRMDNFVIKKHRKEFKKNIIKILRSHGNNSKIHQTYSQNWIGIQYADLISWIIFKKFEKSDEIMFKRLKNKQMFEY
ncbi:MAG: DUF3800 domain-containing protein [Methanobacteriaceae archaeon]